MMDERRSKQAMTESTIHWKTPPSERGGPLPSQSVQLLPVQALQVVGRRHSRHRAQAIHKTTDREPKLRMHTRATATTEMLLCVSLLCMSH